MKKNYVISVLAYLLISVSVHAQSFIISTIAGNGTGSYSGDGGLADTAELYYPSGVAVDAAGNVYIADFYNNRVRKVSTAGIITTFAGNGNGGFSKDGGKADTTELYGPEDVAVDASGNVYIADAGNNRVRKVNTAGIITTFAGNGNAGFSKDGGLADTTMLNQPYGVAVDASGNVYIADAGNNRVRKVNTAGIITSLAGNGNGGFSKDGGLADTTMLNGPNSVAVDASGNVYIADLKNNRIRKVNTAGIISTFAGNGNAGFSKDGGLADTTMLNQPYGVAVDGYGNVYIADLLNNRVRKVTSNGIISTFAGNGTGGYLQDGGLADATEIYNPWGLAVDVSGNLYIADFSNNRIREVTLSPPTIIQDVNILISTFSTGNQWYLNGNAIPGATGQIDTARLNGTYTLKATIGGCTSVAPTVVVISTSIENYFTENTLSVYPNPSSGIFYVKSQTEISTIEVINATGQTVIVQQVNAISATIDLSGQTKGMYFYKVSNNGNILGTGKMIVK